MKSVILGNNSSVNNAIVEILTNAYPAEIITIEFDRHPTAFDLMSLYSSELIIIDFTSTENNSRIMISEIKELAPASKIIVLNIYNQKTLIAQFINAGASSYLQIDILHKHLLNAIDAILRGEKYIATE